METKSFPKVERLILIAKNESKVCTATDAGYQAQEALPELETLISSHAALLEALLAVREWAEKSGQYDKMDKVYSQMQAAIAKAKAEQS